MWESCWTMPLVGGFYRGSLVSPSLSFRRCSILTSITLVGSQDLDVKSLPDLLTFHSNHALQNVDTRSRHLPLPTADHAARSEPRQSSIHALQLRNSRPRGPSHLDTARATIWNVRQTPSRAESLEYHLVGLALKLIRRRTIACRYLTTLLHPRSHAPGGPSTDAQTSDTQQYYTDTVAGAMVAERLARSPPPQENRVFNTRPGHRIFASGNRAGRCRWSAGFSRGSSVSPAPSFRRCSIFTSIILIGSQDLAVKNRPNLFTHSLVALRCSLYREQPLDTRLHRRRAAATPGVGATSGAAVLVHTRSRRRTHPRIRRALVPECVLCCADVGIRLVLCTETFSVESLFACLVRGSYAGSFQYCQPTCPQRGDTREIYLSLGSRGGLGDNYVASREGSFLIANMWCGAWQRFIRLGSNIAGSSIPPTAMIYRSSGQMSLELRKYSQLLLTSPALFPPPNTRIVSARELSSWWFRSVLIVRRMCAKTHRLPFRWSLLPLLVLYHSELIHSTHQLISLEACLLSHFCIVRHDHMEGQSTPSHTERTRSVIQSILQINTEINTTSVSSARR
ncbi:hypothetical protein PR048_002593 [Dryococelus australis]|uniref:Uncharacterized protein n=1 Tax=Dryococelus australis TaxID=614101 RepID=A0ABQ9ILC2_9NEOP|nr:hypothetical protein PR048_002593 [Dryococelus australis]